MRIGIDIDGCINNQHDFVINYGCKYISDNKLPYTIKDYSAENSEQIFGWTSEIAHDFWETYRPVLVKENIRPFCNEIINKLFDEGNEIYIITSRYNGDIWWDSGSRNNVHDITIDFFKHNNIKYTDIIFSQNKLDTIKQYNIDIMLEDNLKNIELISDLVPVFVMSNTYNIKINNDNIIRCYCWYDFCNKFHDFIKKNKNILIFSNRNCDRYITGCRLVGLKATVSNSLEDLSLFDGVILVGGGDVDPELYGQSNISSNNIEKENLIAVQWHPERLLNNDFDTIEGKEIFQIFKDLFLGEYL